MKVNGITSSDEVYSSYKTAAAETAKASVSETAGTEASVSSETGVVYEPTLEIPTNIYKANEQLISKLKSDVDERVAKLEQIVTQLISKQSNAYSVANDIWSALRNGDVEVDAETKAQAEEDISEDGYWGVEQTSDRIIDFAVALTGGDSTKLASMKEAFLKGYKQAEKTWGGELPEISQKTYDAVLQKFDELMSDEN